MIIDIHVHIGKESSGFYSTKEMVLRNMDKNHIDKSVIFPLDDEDAGECFSKSNKRVAEICKNEKRLIGFMRLDPKCDKYVLEETMKKSYSMGLKGIKLHPNSQKFKIDNKTLQPIIGFAREKKIPILCHTCKYDKFSDPTYLIEVAKKNPDVNFIAAHGENIFALAKAMKELDNLYSDTSCITNHSHINYLTTFGDPDKVLFGSDFPFSLPEIEKAKIELSNPNIGMPQKEGMPDEIKAKVLGENAVNILSW